MAANESSAVGSLRTIVTSEFNYQQTYGIGYAPLTNLGSVAPCAPATLATTAAACLVDSQLSSGKKSGYNVTTPVPAAVGTAAAPNTSFTAVAVPSVIGQTGQRGFTRINPASFVSPRMAPPRLRPAPRSSNSSGLFSREESARKSSLSSLRDAPGHSLGKLRSRIIPLRRLAWSSGSCKKEQSCRSRADKSKTRAHRFYGFIRCALWPPRQPTVPAVLSVIQQRRAARARRDFLRGRCTSQICRSRSFRAWGRP